MKLTKIPLWSAAALAAFLVSSEALRSSNDAQPALHAAQDAPRPLKAWPKSPEVTTFVQEAVQAEITEQLHTQLLEQLKADAKLQAEEDKASSILKKLVDVAKPALREVFSAATTALKPVISEECRRVVSAVQESTFGEEDVVMEDELEEGHSFVAAMQANEGFWDSLKSTVKSGIGKMASPALAAIAEKLAPVFQKLGERAVPLFRDQVKDLIRNACSEAEAEAGVL